MWKKHTPKRDNNTDRSKFVAKIVKCEGPKNCKRNKILSTPFSLEGGDIIENKIENLHYFIDKHYGLDVRSLLIEMINK